MSTVLHGLEQVGLACPVLAVGDDQIRHHGVAFRDVDLQAGLAEPIVVPGQPPRSISVDDQSPPAAFDAVVLSALVASLSHQRPHVSISALAEHAVPHLAIFGKAARGRLVVKIDAAARRADRDPASFEYLGPHGHT